MGVKTSEFTDADNNKGHMFVCEPCGTVHTVYTHQDPKGHRVPVWKFNGNTEKPTFKPSVLVRWNDGEEQTPKVCHSFVTDGKIKYLNDCTHELKGQTIDLIDFDTW